MSKNLLILDFGSQYTQLIARRVRELNVYCEIHPFNKIPKNYNFNSVILSGSPCSVNQSDAPSPELESIDSKIPILGICYGAQFLVKKYGGKVVSSKTREYGRANLSFFKDKSPLFNNVKKNSQVWMSHGDTIKTLAKNMDKVASTIDVENAAFKLDNKDIYGIQFHPEVFHTEDGLQIIKNFVINISNCSPDWTPDSFVESSISMIKKTIGDQKVVLGLSGGVDSSVAAILLHKAIGSQLHCIFVDNGLLRKNEFNDVLKQYESLGLNIKGVNAKKDFYLSLKGISDPEDKRKAIGKTFIDIFDREASNIKDVNWLAQGTIYPDIIESVSVNGPSVTIKSHHNVGGLPDYMKLKIIEPLKSLFKDEVRRVGKSLKLPTKILNRHPFPGPGLGIRILGEVTEDRVKILQEVDHIFISGLKEFKLYDNVWQAGAIFLPIQSVGVMGDERTYENAIALRAVSSTDGMTADWCHLPYDFLSKISNRIINNVKGINRVTYDISSKPPATIEWE
ncbi:MAG: glutamine-hydrolyzing GMP synthase [Crocinitomicaceae bacterium]|nr:glutamine-hydrolyzing GMP synthase [Crocinitomicaceae bacterium]|tara:strand:- start:2496 stop:4022 length:1527 start_codon:yes stop_codon:yes gene_type:complete